MDNLNPEFLFPEISKQTELFVSLMKALSTHLKPAPYPYGLLTLRLLGKLGGKNRRVLREPMDIKDPITFEDHRDQLRLSFRWHGEEKSANDAQMGTSVNGQTHGTKRSLPLSIDRCVQIIKQILLLSEIVQNVENFTPSNQTTDACAPLLWKDNEKLWDIRIEDTDLLPYCLDVMSTTQKQQAESALEVLRVALSEMITVGEIDFQSYDFSVAPQGPIHETTQNHDVVRGWNASHSSKIVFDKDFELVGFGLMLGCAIESISDASLQFAKGFLTNTFAVVISHQFCFVRIDANGSTMGSEITKSGTTEGSDIFEEDLGSLKPFGYFEQRGDLENSTNPLIVNKSLAELLAQSSSRAKEVGLILLRHLLNLPNVFNLPRSLDRRIPEEIHRGSLVFFESLLSALCEKCIVTKWNRRDGLYSGICLLLQDMGGKWGRKYEIEVMNVALFSLKSVPKEMSMASVKAFEFTIQVCTILYGMVTVPDQHGIIFDVFTSKGEAMEEALNGENPSELASTKTKDGDNQTMNDAATPLFHPCEDVIQVLITEMASTKNILR